MDDALADTAADTVAAGSVRFKPSDETALEFNRADADAALAADAAAAAPLRPPSLTPAAAATLNSARGVDRCSSTLCTGRERSRYTFGP